MALLEAKFSSWTAWSDRGGLAGLKWPGVYAIRVSGARLSGKAFSWHNEICYFGMTNAAGGLKGRLKQFDNTIVGKKGHGGADRVRLKFQEYEELVGKLYVAVRPFECDVKSCRPSELRIMGEIVKLEYSCLAQFAERFARLPEFNDKKRSLKYSLTIGRPARKK